MRWGFPLGGESLVEFSRQNFTRRGREFSGMI